MIKTVGPKCPECGAGFTQVVYTKNAAGGERVRRRHCKRCEHRFYTEQAQEQVLESWQVAWRGEEVLVQRRSA